jgi:LPS-assembly protein
MTGSNLGRSLKALAARLALVVPAAAAAGVSGAQDAPSDSPPRDVPPLDPTADAAPQAQEDLIYLEADEIFTDPETGRYVARGNVIVRYGQRKLRADEVTVYPESNRVLAIGDPIVVEDDAGIVTYADQAEFTEDLASGVIAGMSTRMPNNAKAGAAVAIRRDPSTNELRRAFYTVCEPCTPEGKPKRPTWRLRARRVTQDADSQMMYYRDAVLEVKGVPVLYAPFFAHADPSSERRSGFLLPYFGESTRTGTFYEQPYYWAISESQDMTLSPRFMSNANPLVLFEHRKKFFSGGSIIQGSITHEQEFDDQGTKSGEREWRGHIFADAEFQMSRHWQWGFAAERVSDDLYFTRYDIDDTDQSRGLYNRGSKRLLSQLFTEGHGNKFHASAAALAFQGLRAEPCPTDPTVPPPPEPLLCSEDDDQLPILLPLAEYDQRLARDVLGGRLDGRLTAAFIERKEGADSRRVSAELDWRRQFIAPSGVVAEPFGYVRADAYSINDFTAPDGSLVDDEISRALGYVGAQVSWPFGRTAGAVDLIVEPMSSIVVGPNGGNDPRIPNNDSQITVLDESNLFSPNRVPGFDLWEDGSHAVLGARAIARWSTNSEASLFVGQSYRSEETTEFGPASGLSGTASDIVGSAELSLTPGRRFATRFQLDEEGEGIQRLDVDAAYDLGPARVTGKYLRLGEEAAREEPESPTEELSFSAGVEFTRSWGAYYAATRDLEVGEDRYAFLGLVYDDECSRFEIIYKRDGTRDRELSEGESIRLQFTLTSIGTIGGG